MFFVSLSKPTKAQEQAVCEKGLRCGSLQLCYLQLVSCSSPVYTAYLLLYRLGFNFNSAGGSLHAPPLSEAAQEDGWWNIDHERIKVSTYRTRRTSRCCNHPIEPTTAGRTPGAVAAVSMPRAISSTQSYYQ
eukprot:GHUV01041529.1.p1 GENE.GHUV01041529.1~~GHUV01041529.1.p1  ORF type:complete len:132 (-),score=20.67 GHUV01041529.1:692-1087(-)